MLSIRSRKNIWIVKLSGHGREHLPQIDGFKIQDLKFEMLAAYEELSTG